MHSCARYRVSVQAHGNVPSPVAPAQEQEILVHGCKLTVQRGRDVLHCYICIIFEDYEHVVVVLSSLSSLLLLLGLRIPRLPDLKMSHHDTSVIALGLAAWAVLCVHAPPRVHMKWQLACHCICMLQALVGIVGWGTVYSLWDLVEVPSHDSCHLGIRTDDRSIHVFTREFCSCGCGLSATFILPLSSVMVLLLVDSGRGQAFDGGDVDHHHGQQEVPNKTSGPNIIHFTIVLMLHTPYHTSKEHGMVSSFLHLFDQLFCKRFVFFAKRFPFPLNAPLSRYRERSDLIFLL